MMQETAKEFFKVKDLLVNLINFLKYQAFNGNFFESTLKKHEPD